MRLFFVRHGESEANVQRIFSNSGSKHPLTEKGRRQVRELGEKLANFAIGAIFTSPILRARQSAQILADRFDLSTPCEVMQGLAEWDVGIFEDRPHDEGMASYAQVERDWVAGKWDARMEGGESCHDIRARFVPAIEQVIARFRDNPRANVLLVGHGGTYRHALPMVLQNVSCQFTIAHPLSNADYVEAELRAGALRCVRWAREVLA